MSAPLPSAAMLEPLIARYGKLQMRFAALQGQAKELRARQAALVATISLAKARIDLAPAATEVFDLIQERAHQQAVGEFETLLSAFVEDVFPDSDNAVSLSLGTERGAPALDIQINNGGNLEGILEGNGGALTNVVSTGLVYAALSRTKNRRLVVLDEPDCWLKPDRVPAFARVIAEASAKMSCQTLLISHHDAGLMDPDTYLIDLVLKDDQPAAVPVGPVYAWPDDAEVGVRWIELENVRRHVKTRVPLAPDANALIGDNNLGKSTAFSTALRAMAYGEMDDTLIRHGEPCAFIRIGLENQIVLEMERRRAPASGTPKLVYRKYVAGALTNEAAPKTRGSVPDFVTKALRIDYVDGLDIQVRSQKQPIFLLNEPSSRRAQLLSVGRESGLWQAVIEKHRLTLKRDRDQVRRDEAELNRINRKLDELAPLTGMTTLVEIIDSLQAEATAAAIRFAQAQHNATQTARLQARVDSLSPLDSGEHRLPDAPVIVDTTVLARLVQNLERYGQLAALSDAPMAPEAPALTNTAALAELVPKLAHAALLSSVADIFEQSPLLPSAAPAIWDRSNLVQQGKRLTEGEASIAKLEKEMAEAQQAEKAAEKARQGLMDELGVCPLCTTPFNQGKPHVHA